MLLVLPKGSFLSANMHLVSQHGKQRGQEALVNLVSFLSALSNTIAIRHACLLSTENEVNVTEKMNFLLNLI